MLGNRLTRVDGGIPVTGGHNYSWDILNRMTQYAKGTPGSWTQYTYRADGLRVLKSKHLGGGQLEQTHYRYDGQMGTEDLVTTGPAGAQVIESVTRYGLGARGIDVISRTTSSETTVAYPIYDAHGNNVGLISRNGANYAVSQERSYDAWGAIRSGIKDTTRLTYCANLGHKEDDESGLIYMRARYYEPASGRFVSEDPARDGENWFAYGANDPVGSVDSNGKQSEAERLNYLANVLIWLGMQMISCGTLDGDNAVSAIASAIKNSIRDFHLKAFGDKESREIRTWLTRAFDYVMMSKSAVQNGGSFTGRGVVAVAGYMVVLYGMLMMIDSEMMGGGGDWWGFNG